MQSIPPRSSLFKTDGVKQEHLLSQYIHFCETADRVSDKRHTMNGYFLAILVLLSTIGGYLLDKEYFRIALIIGMLMGLSLSILWFMAIRSYKELNACKYKVIHELEKMLPAKLYTYEYELLKSKYFSLTKIERIIPIIFAILFGLGLLYLLTFSVLSYLW